MKFRTTVATTLAAAAAVLTLGAAPAGAATAHQASAHPAVAAAHSRASVHSWMTKPYKTVHGTNVYKAGHPFFLYATFSPNKTGHQSVVQLQFEYKGQWKAIDLGAKAHDPILRGSRTWFGWPHGLPVQLAGVKFRVAISYPGDSANRASKVTWHTFEVVK